MSNDSYIKNEIIRQINKVNNKIKNNVIKSTPSILENIDKLEKMIRE